MNEKLYFLSGVVVEYGPAISTTDLLHTLSRTEDSTPLIQNPTFGHDPKPEPSISKFHTLTGNELKFEDDCFLGCCAV
jgi:hypothetical protein